MTKKYGRFVGIDVGTKKVGLARTDLLQTAANPVATCPRNKVIEHLAEMVTQGQILAFVVGWPLEPDGTEGAMTKTVQKFIDELKHNFSDIPVYKIDERFTSKQAVQQMVEAGVPMMKRRDKKRIDQAAAAIILQNFLEMHSDF